MEGRRVNSRSQKTNPLFILFLCMIAAIVVLLIVSVVLGVKLGKANKDLKTARSQVSDLEQTIVQLQTDLEAARSPVSNIAQRDDSDAASADSSGAAEVVSWLDLSGHSEVAVKPSSLLDGYKTYYATAGVNVRSGPGTSYERIEGVAYGDEVQVAARENGWSFAKVGGKFGWISSDYLSTTKPPAQTQSVKRTEATSGSLKTN